MAIGRIELSAKIEGLREAFETLSKILPREARADVFEKALEKAVYPVYQRLGETTPIGPTGNLYAARDYKIVKYPATGVAVALVGYRRAMKGSAESAAGGSVKKGRDRAPHQWWLEQGTSKRYVMSPANRPFLRRSHVRRTAYGPTTVRDHMVKWQGGYIASSYNKLGPFTMAKINRKSETRVQTDPAYPRAFFRKSKNPIEIREVPAGGTFGQPPLETAWNDMQPRVVEYLTNELTKHVEDVVAAFSYTPTGTLGR